MTKFSFITGQTLKVSEQASSMTKAVISRTFYKASLSSQLTFVKPLIYIYLYQASSRGEAKDTALLSSRDGYILELTVWPKMSQASCGVWREDSGLLSRPYSKRRPSSREDWGVSWVFSSCGSSVVLLTRYNGELREPLLWRQGSQVSMRVARGSASLLSSHGRGIAPQDALKKDSRGLLRVGAGNPWFPRLVPVISGRSKGASEKSGILCSWEGPLGTPLGSVQWKRASSRVEAGNSCFLS